MVAASLEWLGGLDVLVNSIGIGAGAGPLHQVAEADIDRVLSVNLGTIYNMCRQTIPALMEGQGKAIVNISRSEERRVGKKWVSKCRSRRSTTPKNKKNITKEITNQ